MKWSAGLVALVPPGVVTVTSTVPEPGGASAVTEEVLPTEKEVAGVEPNQTAVTPAKWVPVMVTAVAPPVGPDDGLTPLTVGAVLSALAWEAWP